MGGWVTWTGIGITGFIAGWEAFIASDPELGAMLAGLSVVVIGIARKIEKVLKALKN